MKLLSLKGSTMLLTLLTLVSLIFLTGCPPEPEEPTLPEIELNPDFIQNPPIADEIFVEKLEESVNDRNIRLTAHFSGIELEKLNDSLYFAMLLDNEKVVLRDDGQGGDEQAEDNIFTVLLQEDEQLLEQQIDRANARIDESEVNEFRWFKARQVVQSPKIGKVNKERFTGNSKIRVDQIFRVPFFITGNVQTNSLMITDTDVVEDPTRTIPNPCSASPGDETKAWTFGKLMSEMANTGSTGVTVSDFTLKWLETWTNDLTINSDFVDERDPIETLIINPWKTASNFNVTGELAMEKAPFKLIAIVNRIDLRGNSFYGGGGAGEGRFIFAPVNLNNSCSIFQDFTVIFEYGVNINGCSNVKAYGQSWFDLKDEILGSAAYNTALQAITDQFTLANTNPSKPNGSSLNQIRTNERTIGSPWELREFVLCDPGNPDIQPCVPGFLVTTTTTKEPNSEYNRLGPGSDPAKVKELAQWANANAGAILAENFDIPRLHPLTSDPFLGGHALPLTPSYFWDGEVIADPDPITNDDVRHLLSLNTCSGCHAGETETDFTHVSPPAAIGSAASLSGFLTGITVEDPADRPSPGSATMRMFDDLQRREDELTALVNSNCIRVFDLVLALKTPPFKFVH